MNFKHWPVSYQDSMLSWKPVTHWCDMHSWVPTRFFPGIGNERAWMTAELPPPPVGAAGTAPRSWHFINITHKYFIYWDNICSTKSISQHFQAGREGQVPPFPMTAGAHACIDQSWPMTAAVKCNFCNASENVLCMFHNVLSRAFFDDVFTWSWPWQCSQVWQGFKSPEWNPQRGQWSLLLPHNTNTTRNARIINNDQF